METNAVALNAHTERLDAMRKSRDAWQHLAEDLEFRFNLQWKQRDALLRQIKKLIDESLLFAFDESEEHHQQPQTTKKRDRVDLSSGDESLLPSTIPRKSAKTRETASPNVVNTAEEDDEAGPETEQKKSEKEEWLKKEEERRDKIRIRRRGYRQKQREEKASMMRELGVTDYKQLSVIARQQQQQQQQQQQALAQRERDRAELFFSQIPLLKSRQDTSSDLTTTGEEDDDDEEEEDEESSETKKQEWLRKEVENHAKHARRQRAYRQRKREAKAEEAPADDAALSK